MFDLVSFGAATVDIFARSSSFTVANGLISLPYSSKSEISTGLITSGGGASNAAVACSRLGLKTACVALVGHDHLHCYILDDFSQNNVTPLLAYDDQSSTDYSVILVGPDGGRSILTNRGQTSLQDKDIPWDKISSRWFYITSLEGNLDLLERLIGFAVENQIKVALNPGNRELNQPNRLVPLFKYVDYLQFNKTESEIIVKTDISSPEFWHKLSLLGSAIVAVTNGRQGAHVLCSHEHLFSPVLNVKPVEETGAGDGFGSAFVSALFYQKPAKDALFWGIKNSASVVSLFGAKPGLLTLPQINS